MKACAQESGHTKPVERPAGPSPAGQPGGLALAKW